jgi:primary-amine oxidase
VSEVVEVSELVKAHFNHDRVKFNAITLREPTKVEYTAYRDHNGPLPDRLAFAILLLGGSCHVTEVIVNLTTKKIVSTQTLTDVMPILTLEDLDVCERVARADPKVLETCEALGINDINEVFFDGWAIGIDERFGFDRRLQMGLAYWRSSEADNQYAHPLDFTVVIDTEKEEVLRIDVKKVNGERVPIPKVNHNFWPQFIQDSYNNDRLKPLDITQPKVSPSP